MPSGGRPIYTEDFQTLQNEISIFEHITSQNCGDCVLSGCKYTESGLSGNLCTVNVSEGYVLINGKICHVDAATFTSFNITVDYPVHIKIVQSDSVERAQLKNGETAPLTTIYEAQVVKHTSAIQSSYITLNRKKNSTDERNNRFTQFYDLYAGFTKKAEVEDVNKRAYIIDLFDYKEENSILPTLNAVFVYGRHILQPCTITIPVSDDPKFGGLPEGTYYIFCIRHYFSTSTEGRGTDFLLYNWSRKFVASYNSDTVLECIKDVFGESIATYDKDGRMSKEHVKALTGKADKTYVDTELSKKVNADATYTKNQMDSALALKLDRSEWENNMDILWGEVKMWAGDNVPEKYALCDGTHLPIPPNYPNDPSAPYYDIYKAIGKTFNITGANGTPDGRFALPDLRGRFIVGKGRGTGDREFLFKETGGASEVTLTTEQIPVHRHTVPSDDWDNGGTAPYSQYGIENYRELSYGPGESGAGGVCDSGPAGGGGAHNNLPPFYTLAYIMRVTK